MKKIFLLIFVFYLCVNLIFAGDISKEDKELFEILYCPVSKEEQINKKAKEKSRKEFCYELEKISLSGSIFCYLVDKKINIYPVLSFCVTLNQNFEMGLDISFIFLGTHINLYLLQTGFSPYFNAGIFCYTAGYSGTEGSGNNFEIGLRIPFCFELEDSGIKDMYIIREIIRIKFINVGFGYMNTSHFSTCYLRLEQKVNF
ncbi:MAG: hypothetical protein N3E50_09820 [Candidatus Goldbacteria bacterium]|nr:hypothetical protein [Candidatus Goldiibacteriota bacterium]